MRLPVGTIIGATRSGKELRVGDKVFDLASETTAPDALAGAKAGIIVGTQGGKIAPRVADRTTAIVEVHIAP